MEHPKTSNRVLLLTVTLALVILVWPVPVHAAEIYSLGTIPSSSQEGSTMTLILSVTQAIVSTTYQFRFIVTDPANNNVTSNTVSHTTGSAETSFSIVVSYPSAIFPGGSTSLIGTYKVRLDQTSPTALTNAASSAFGIEMTDNSIYQRTQTVSIVATGYTAGTTATVTIRTSITSLLVHTLSALVPASGQVIDSWQIPKNATTSEAYVVSVTGTPSKNPADSQIFNVLPASITISSLSSTKGIYQRTETLMFSFRPLYPNGQLATTGSAVVTLTSPANRNVTLSAVFNATAQLFVAQYKTSSTNQTGTWTARLATGGYNDGFGNVGPGSILIASTQLQPASLLILITVKSYFLVNEPIQFNATITYRDGSSLSAGNVTSVLAFAPGGYQTKVPTIYDTLLGLWIGTYTPKGNEPGGLWSLTMNVSDYATVANQGVATRVIQLQDRPPLAVLSLSITTTVTGSVVSFNGGGSSDPDGSISSYKWDFGDGTSATGASAAHAYANPGTYTVRLTVTDNSGSTSSTSSSVLVRAATTTGSPFPALSTQNWTWLIGILGVIAVAIGILIRKSRRVTHQKIELDLEAVHRRAAELGSSQFIQSVQNQVSRRLEQMKQDKKEQKD